MTYRLVLWREDDGSDPARPRLVRDLSCANPIQAGDEVWVPGDADEPIVVDLVIHRPGEGLSEVHLRDEVPERDVPAWLALGFREEET